MATGIGAELLVERPLEEAFLKGAITHSFSSGHSSVGAFVALQAPTGIGKTHLVDRVVSQIERAHKIVFSRINAPSPLNHVSFRTIVFTALLRDYLSRIEDGEDLPADRAAFFSDRRKKAFSKGLTSVLDGITFGATTALKSLLELFKSRESTVLDDILLDDIETEEAIDAFFDAVSGRVLPAIALSDAQRLNERNLVFLLDRVQRWKAQLILEYTMPSFDRGVVNRERLHELASLRGLVASAMTLAPLEWNQAYHLNGALKANDKWAQRYYERHGYNLFDLRNLTGSEADEYESALFEDISFGPDVLPGLTSRYPATLKKIKGLTRDEQFVLCVIGLHGDFVRYDVLKSIAPAHLAGNLHNVVRSLRESRLVSERAAYADHNAFGLAHESIWRSLEQAPPFIPFLKLGARAWQDFYASSILDPAAAQGPYELERLIRLAHFSAMVSDSGRLLSACQTLGELSKTVVVEGEFSESFLSIITRNSSSSLIPEKTKALVAYYLGAAALNFGNTRIAHAALANMPQESFGALTLSAFIHLRDGEYAESAALLAVLIEALNEDEFQGDSYVPIRLASIVSRQGMAKNAVEIAEVKTAYRDLMSQTRKDGDNAVLVLKHSSITHGYRASLTFIDEAIASLDAAGRAYDANQARLIKLMQLTRLGRLSEAHDLARSLDGRFPRNFGEIGNLWNILGILACYDRVSATPLIPSDLLARRHFVRALVTRSDDFSRIVLMSNLFVFDHFLAGDSVSNGERVKSLEALRTILETTTIGFRYLHYLGWYNLMRYHEQRGNEEEAREYRRRIGAVTDEDSLLWRAAMGVSSGAGTEVEFLTRTPFMFAFLPNYELAAPTFSSCVESISRIIRS